MNVLNVAGVTYDIDKLSEDVQESCVYLNKAQQLAGKIQAEFDSFDDADMEGEF